MTPFLPSDALTYLRQQLDTPNVVVHQLTAAPPAAPTAWEAIPHAEWVPAGVRAWAAYANGLTVEWRSRTPQPAGLGFIDLLPIEQLYGDWKDIIYFDFHDHPEDAWHKVFKIADAIQPRAQACVGLFHTPQRNPQLFYYPYEGQPEPLGVDLPGYVELLAHSLGGENWQLVLPELLHTAQRPYVPASPATQAFVDGMQDLVPAFDLTALVECFDRVRLPH